MSLLRYHCPQWTQTAKPRVPEKPALEGLETKWQERWDADGTYQVRSHASRATRSTPSTRRRRPSAGRCTSATCFRTPTPTSSRGFSGCAAREVFYPMGWDDNGLPTERRVQNYYGVRCDPSLPYDPNFQPPPEPPKQPISISRPNFVELCLRLTKEDEKAFEHLWRYLGLSVDWSMTYATIDKRSQRASQIGFLHLLKRGPRVSARSADAVGRGFPHGRRAGRARGSRARRRVSPAAVRSA